MKKSARTPSFGLHNSTDKWVLIVDDYFGYFDAKKNVIFITKKQVISLRFTTAA